MTYVSENKEENYLAPSIMSIVFTSFKATWSVTFDLLILEIMFLFFKKTAKKLKYRYTFYQFRQSQQIISIKTTAFMLKINHQ